jgi:sulfoxide reductase heme-binding subunit YedZ
VTPAAAFLQAILGRLNAWLLHPWVPHLMVVFWLLPAFGLVLAAANDQLGANPAQALVRQTGEMTLRMLCVTLLITPLRVTFGLSALARLRRCMGLVMFTYAVLHLLCYAGFDMGLDLVEMAHDLAKRPFILVGFLAWLLLLPLALTSFNRAIRFLGARRWQMLHRLVYAVAVLAVLHFFWMRASKNNLLEVWVYGSLLALMLGWRLLRYVRQARLKPAGF